MKQFRASSDLNSKYHSVSTWMMWRPRVEAQIRKMDLPPVMLGELECALDLHGDNLLDLYRDEMEEEIEKYYLADYGIVCSKIGHLWVEDDDCTTHCDRCDVWQGDVEVAAGGTKDDQNRDVAVST